MSSRLSPDTGKPRSLESHLVYEGPGLAIERGEWALPRQAKKASVRLYRPEKDVADAQRGVWRRGHCLVPFLFGLYGLKLVVWDSKVREFHGRFLGNLVHLRFLGLYRQVTLFLRFVFFRAADLQRRVEGDPQGVWSCSSQVAGLVPAGEDPDVNKRDERGPEAQHQGPHLVNECIFVVHDNSDIIRRRRTRCLEGDPGRKSSPDPAVEPVPHGALPLVVLLNLFYWLSLICGV